MRRLILLILAFTVCSLSFNVDVVAAVVAQPSNDTEASLAPDYSQPANWVCRPGKEEICTTGLDAKVIFADGTSAIKRFAPASSPEIDCFYVYPTVSTEPRDYADLKESLEIDIATKLQAGRLSSNCRIFAPLYRQATLKYLRDGLTGAHREQRDYPADDINAAWNYYLEYENHGRGVVLIGHSQGTILLQQLMRDKIDPDPAIRERLVSAFLAGDPSLGVPVDAKVGGTFLNIPLCMQVSEIGCVYAWGSYLAQDVSRPLFGHARMDGLMSACRNPAAPSGGQGSLKFYHLKPKSAPPNDPPFIETLGQLTGTCKSVGAMRMANVFEVSILEGPGMNDLTALLQKSERGPRGGIHPQDISLVQGNILDVLDAEIATWQKVHDRR